MYYNALLYLLGSNLSLLSKHFFKYHTTHNITILYNKNNTNYIYSKTTHIHINFRKLHIKYQITQALFPKSLKAVFAIGKSENHTKKN